MNRHKFFSCTGAILPIAVCGFFIYFSTLFSQQSVTPAILEPTQERTAAASITTPRPDKKTKGITLVTIHLLLKQHYSGNRFTPALSEFIFNEYLKNLDPGHMFFTQEDIAEFSAKKLDLHNQLMKGNADFAFDVFARFMARFQQYEFFADTFTKEGADLNTDATFVFDRSKAEWPKNSSELAALWKKKLTNDIILSRLSDRATKENAEKNPVTDDDGNVIPPFVDPKTPEERIMKRISQLKNYYQGLESINVLEMYLSTVAGVFDPHSAYMSPRTGSDFDISMSLSLQGIGATLTTEEGYTKVVSLVPGGPAEKEGHLKPEDRIIAVSQENSEKIDVIDMPLSKVVDMIRGKRGTKVTLTVLEAEKGGSGVPVNITITRDKVEIKDSEAKGKIHVVRDESGAEKRIGVITLPSFYMDFDAAKRGDPNFKSSSGDVKKIIEEFEKQGIDGIIVDLRSNGGGSLYEAVALTGLFIDYGPVVQIRDKKDIEVQNDMTDGTIYNGPLVVLVNKFSASASEIFAGAIKDYGRGFIAGDAKTHGKGTVQILSELDRYLPVTGGVKFNAGVLKLTNAKFYRINGESTQRRGVASDIVYPAYTEFMDTGEDKLEHALEWDTIPEVDFVPFENSVTFNRTAKKLSGLSAARIAKDKEFQTLTASIAEFRRLKDSKEIALNIEKRWAQYLEDKKVADEQEKLLKEDNKKKQDNDLYLKETLNVILDLINIKKGIL